MKSLKSLIAVIALLLACSLNAQVSVNVTAGTPPLWGPVGYTDVRYYYLPDVESYYDIQASMFICYVEGGWVHKTKLPSKYKSYDPYEGYKVVLIDYHGNAPYKDFADHKAKYAKGYKGSAQKTYGEKPGQWNKGENGGSGMDQGSSHDGVKEKHQ